MGNSVFLAKIIGPYILVIAIGLLFNSKTYQKMMDDFLQNTAFIYLGGVIALVIGIVMVLFHNIWVAGWQLIITIFGWMGLIKGIWLIIFPNSAGKFTQALRGKTKFLTAYSLILIAVGAFLTFKGYFA
ncbi:hypothetical protein ACFL1D_04715 [Candidatus Omnitrophota bacterium]